MSEHIILSEIIALRREVTAAHVETLERLTTLETILLPPNARSLPERVETLERWNYRAAGAMGLATLAFEGAMHWLSGKNH